jgi:hypothetical protein
MCCILRSVMSSGTGIVSPVISPWCHYCLAPRYFSSKRTFSPSTGNNPGYSGKRDLDRVLIAIGNHLILERVG